MIGGYSCSGLLDSATATLADKLHVASNMAFESALSVCVIVCPCCVFLFFN